MRWVWRATPGKSRRPFRCKRSSRFFSARCGSPLCLTVKRSPIAGSKPSVEFLRRNVEFYGYAHCGHTNLVSGNGTAQGVGGARVLASGSRQVHGERPDGGAVFSESRVEARRG